MGARRASRHSSGLLDSCSRKEPPAGKVGSRRVGKAGKSSADHVGSLGGGKPSAPRDQGLSGSEREAPARLVPAERVPEAHACPRLHCTASGNCRWGKRARLAWRLLNYTPVFRVTTLRGDCTLNPGMPKGSWRLKEQTVCLGRSPFKEWAKFPGVSFLAIFYLAPWLTARSCGAVLFR